MKNQNPSRNFRNRKLIHYSLIFCIIALQGLLTFLFINELNNEKKLIKLQKKIDHSQIELNNSTQTFKTLLESQNFLNESILNGNNLNSYYESLNQLYQKIDTLKAFTENKKEYISSLQLLDTLKQSNHVFKEKLDSIIQSNNILKTTKTNSFFKLNEYNYDDVLKGINVETYLKVDSVAKKGFFSRIGDAVVGNVPVQKEKINIVITLKIGDKTTRGNIKEQFQSILKKTDSYYQNQFIDFKNNINQFNDEKRRILEQNSKFLSISKSLLQLYDKAILEIHQNEEKQYEDQYKKNKGTQFFIFIGILVLMIFITILIFTLTRFAFKNEKKLNDSNLIIEQNNIFKNRLIGMLSHEIRSPLSVISIYISLISEKITESKTLELFKPLQFTVQSLLLLSNQILDYSKYENKKLTLINTTFDLTSEIDAILTPLSEMVASNNNKLIVSNELDKNLIVVSDKAKIHQLFYNLIGNANKFTKDGIIEVLIIANNKANNDSFCGLSVVIKDNGTGISKNDLPFIFDPYYKGATMGNTTALGSGLGLNLCKEIVTLFNGSLTAKSEIGKGTVINFDIQLDLEKH